MRTRRFAQRVLAPTMVAAGSLLAAAGVSAPPAGGAPAVATAPAAPAGTAISPGCDTTTVPVEEGWFNLMIITGSQACRKCDEQANYWASKYYYRALCVEMGHEQAWLFLA